MTTGVTYCPCHTGVHMLTVRKRGDGHQAIVRVKQHGVITYQKAQTFESEKLARDWGRRLEDKLRKEGVPTRLRSQLTLGELMFKYTVARDEVKPLRRPLRNEIDLLDRLLGQRKLESLTSDALVAFARQRRKDGAGPTTVLHNLTTIRAILNAAKPMFGIDVDGSQVSLAIAALTRTGHVGRSTHRDRRTTPVEIDLLIAEFNRIASNPSTILPMQVIVPLAVEFPRRLGELCSMRWADLSEGIMILRDTKHPTAPRTEKVPVPPAAQALIEQLPRIDERILPYREDTVSAALRRAADRIGLKDLRFHDLRHEGISRLFEKGLSIQEVSLISGHQSWSMLKRYTHLSPGAILEKLNGK